MCCRGEKFIASTVLHWNYRGFTEFPFRQLKGDESEITDIYLKENLISCLPSDIGRLERLESLYLSGNDIRDVPVEIGKLLHLKCLDLSGNRLTRLPEEIGDVKNLKFLILDDNEIVELPLRLSELRCLRYLSVCDNKLRWLPQRPVYNYHHCEFRFWRNYDLKAIPYSLWYHMFRGEAVRTLNIGCLGTAKNQTRPSHRRQLKFQTGEAEWKIEIHVPPHYNNVMLHNTNSPATLLEISKRVLYQTLYKSARMINDNDFSIYNDNNGNQSYFEECVDNLSDGFNVLNTDLNVVHFKVTPFVSRRIENNNKRQKNYTPGDLVKEFYDYLPKFMKKDLCNGVVSRCENLSCKIPVFDYVHVRFCLGKIQLIDESTEDAVLSAIFCSNKCANSWQKAKSNVLSWSLIYS